MNTTSFDSPCSSSVGDAEIQDWIKNGGFIILILVCIQSFFGLAHVCDEFFCPSLEILCEEFDISDDIAGATFMAIGTSAGDLMISVLSLFVSKSNLGIFDFLLTNLNDVQIVLSHFLFRTWDHNWIGNI